MQQRCYKMHDRSLDAAGLLAQRSDLQPLAPVAGIPVTLLKGGPGAVVNLTEANFNQNCVLYVKQAGAVQQQSGSAENGGGGGLSAGAITGAAVTAKCSPWRERAHCLVGGCLKGQPGWLA